MMILFRNNNIEIFIKILPPEVCKLPGWKNWLGRSRDLCGLNSICLRSSVCILRDVADPVMGLSRACSIYLGRRPIFDLKSVLKPECQAGIAKSFCALWETRSVAQTVADVPERMKSSEWGGSVA